MLIETYRLLRADTNCQVVHKLISGNNFARSVLRFARSVDADVLLTNTEEMKVSGIAGLDILDLVEGESKLQLLTIETQ
jgi:hypothetical protein